jgi:hypothetical protein
VLGHRLEGGAPSFRYLAESSSSAEPPCFALEDVDDGEGLRSTLDAMRIVGIGEVRAVQKTLDGPLPGSQLSTEETCLATRLLQARHEPCSEAERMCMRLSAGDPGI